MQGRIVLLRKGFLYTTILSFIFIVFLSSCKEDFTELGESVIPDDEYLGFQRDTLIAIDAYTLQSPVYPTNNQDSKVFLGVVNDPVFGKSQYSFMTEIGMPTKSLFDGESVVEVDSAILKLIIRDSYGELLTPQTFNVYSLSSELVDSVTYYNDEDPEPFYSEGDLISENVYKDGDSLYFKLSDFFAERLLEDYNDTLDLINGIYCKAMDHENGYGYVHTIDLLRDTTSSVLLYYKDSISSESQSVYFTINTIQEHIEFTKHTKEGYPVEEYLQNDTTIADSLLYIKGMNGTDIKLKFKELTDWIASGPYAINDVKLKLKVDDNVLNSYGIFDIPNRLTIRQGKSINYLFDISSYDEFDYAEYDETNQEYVFKITEPFIEHITNEDYEEYSLFIRLPNYASDPSRVVLQGGELEVFVTYTKLEE